MGLADMLLNTHGGGATELLAQRFGISPEQAASAVSALVPALASGLQQNTANEGGFQWLLGALAGRRDQQYVEDPQALDRPDTIADGNAILGHVLGSKDVLWRMVREATWRSPRPRRLPTGHTGGTSDASAQREEVECRPWPANGSWFSPSFTPPSSCC